MVMPAAGVAVGGGGAAPAEEEAPAKVEQTEFAVVLEAFDSAAKIKLIKEVRAYTGLGLKEAKLEKLAAARAAERLVATVRARWRAVVMVPWMVAVRAK